MSSQEVLIEAYGLTKKFDDFTAVDHIDFKVYKGECVGFLGPNGAGKTNRYFGVFELSLALGQAITQENYAALT